MKKVVILESRREPQSALAAVGAAEAPQGFDASERRMIIGTGQAVGEGMVSGVARYVASIEELAQFQAGEILLAKTTSPEWRPAMEIAAAIITEDGALSHSAVVARQLGVPAIVGTVDGASKVWSGASLTVFCGTGEVGVVYENPPRADATLITGDCACA